MTEQLGGSEPVTPGLCDLLSLAGVFPRPGPLWRLGWAPWLPLLRGEGSYISGEQEGVEVMVWDPTVLFPFLS